MPTLNNHLYIVNGIARDLAAERPRVYSILGNDPFMMAPEWATCIRPNKQFGFCWCDLDVTTYEPMIFGSPDHLISNKSEFGEVVATRLVNNE